MSRIREQIAEIVKHHQRQRADWVDAGVEVCNCAWEGADHDQHLTDLIDAFVANQYEFDCPAFVYAGPGHQSRHDCEDRSPHPLDGEHSNWRYNWEGTAIMQDVDGRRKLIFNPRHHGGDCC